MARVGLERGGFNMRESGKRNPKNKVFRLWSSFILAFFNSSNVSAHRARTLHICRNMSREGGSGSSLSEKVAPHSHSLSAFTLVRRAIG